MAHSLFCYTGTSQFFIAFIPLDIAWKDLNIAQMVQVISYLTFFVYMYTATRSSRALMNKNVNNTSANTCIP